MNAEGNGDSKNRRNAVLTPMPQPARGWVGLEVNAGPSGWIYGSRITWPELTPGQLYE